MRTPPRSRQVPWPAAATPGVVALAVLSIAPALAAQSPGAPQDADHLRMDPDRVVITDSRAHIACGWCHTAEWEVWRESRHATGFDDMHRRESARDILGRMGLRTARHQDAICMRCHYTIGQNRRAVAGVSCESCHGPARDWMDVHNDWGPGVTHPSQETTEHRERRIAASVAAGMLRPSGDLYAVAANCFDCHTVPHEPLVNRGGHVTGSTDFDLVGQMERVRHNFVHRQWGDAGGNRPPTAERTRVMFVVGRLLAYEYSLRGLAEATAEGRYSAAMGRRVTAAHRALEATTTVSEVPEILEALHAGAGLRLVPGNRDALEAAADEVRRAGQRFTRRSDGGELAALDPLIAGERPAVSTPRPAPAAEPGPAAEEPVPETTAPAADRVEPDRPSLPGRIRSRPEWMPEPAGHAIVGAGRCSSCHARAEDWWFDDPHQRSGRRLLGEDPRARQIAEAYGIGAGAMARGDRICMACHGTVDAGARTVREDGVSCESCHGAGSGYLEAHEQGGNPQLGMTALKQADARARTCAGCHRISDERLLAAGHPSGADFDIVQATGRIEHWPDRRPTRGRERRGEPPYSAVADAALARAFAALASARPIPDVAPVATVRAPARPARPAATPAAAAPAGAPPGREVAGPTSPPRPPAALPPRTTPTQRLDLEPLPEDLDELTVEELLLLVKRRLERLQAAIGRGG